MIEQKIKNRESEIKELEQISIKKVKDRWKMVIFYRLLFLAVTLGGWEILGRVGVIDPFFFSIPSKIIYQIYIWIIKGTSQGPLWVQVLVTLEETVLGFLIGAVMGIICGIALGRNKMLADIFSIYIKIANAIPRIVLGSIFIIALGLGMASKVALAVVMVFFVVFGNALDRKSTRLNSSH